VFAFFGGVKDGEEECIKSTVLLLVKTELAR